MDFLRVLCGFSFAYFAVKVFLIDSQNETFASRFGVIALSP
jgi:hypothetical protein